MTPRQTWASWPAHPAEVPQGVELPFDADDLDAWECSDCGGTGRVTVYHDVTHQLGTDSLPFWEECPTCEGLKFCGPDAEKRAAVVRAAGGAA